MITPEFILIDPDGHVIGFPDDGLEAVNYVIDNPGVRPARLSELVFNVVVSTDEDLLRQCLRPYIPSPAPSEVRKLSETMRKEDLFPARKITAIKECRAVFYLTLAESKAVMDSYWDKKGIR